MKLQGRAVVLLVLLVFVPLTAILTASPAHAGPAPVCYTGQPPYKGICIVIGQPDLTTLTSGQPSSLTTIGNPTAVVFDSKGDAWVVDTTNNRVLEYEPPFTTGEAASLVIGQTSLTGTGDTSSAGSFFGPTGIAFDSFGNLWVVDSGNNRVLEFKTPFSNGESASLVIGQPTFAGYVGQTTSGGLNAPAYLAFDSFDNLWVTDQGNNRVLEFTYPFSTGQKASVVIGQADFTSFAPSSTVTANSLFEPLGITFDSNGDLWVVDSGNNRVLEYNSPFSTDESASTVIGQSSLTGTSTGLHAYAIAFDSGGNLWVSDGISGVAEYQGPVSTGEAGIQEVGPTTVTTTTTTSPGDKLRDPQGIAFDANDNLWVADYDHGRVVVYGSTVVRTTPSSSSSSCRSTTASDTLGGAIYSNATTASGTLGGGIYDNATASTSTGSGTLGGGIYGAASASTTDSCPSTMTSGGVPVFPYQLATAVAFTALIAASYLLVRRRTRPRLMQVK